jgi:uncharacterized membrane protein (UPF0182 family)
MRAPDDLPRRRPRRASSGRRRRTLLIAAVVILFVLLMSLRGIAGFYTDYLWFDSLEQSGVWRGILGAKAILAVVFMGVFFALAWVNLFVADRMAPPYRVAGPEDELLERYHDVIGERAGLVRIGVAALLALIAGSGVSSEWNSWLLFANGGNFGVEDEQFGRDVGFYVFKLPFLSFVVDWLFASLLIVVIVTAVAHYLNGGIRVQPPGPRVTSQVKAHLSVLLAVLAIVKAVDYWLQRFELTGSSRGVVDGASYTDVNAQLPALNLLVLISVAAAVLFVVNIFRRGWVLPAVAMGLWAFVAIVVGGIYPQWVQRFQVQPNELARERPYIERNITATRDALGIDGVRTQPYELTTDPEQVSLAGSADTVRNIRLWDPTSQLSGQTFEQLQQIRDYYAVDDVDVDRYEIDGAQTQVNIGVRTINSAGLPGESWENQHVAFTHGYGVVLAPSNASEGNEPEFLISDIPPRVQGEGLELTQPSIYFGENLGDYIVVGTGRDEIDFQAGDRTEITEYDGEDGVEAGSLIRKAAFALRFGDLNPLITDYINDDSRFIYIRDIVDRVETLAPFLHADNDPYPVVIDGQVQWVLDLYTSTERYPYAEEADTDQLPSGSGLDHDFNYVRNSVKATVDAYDGTVTFYAMDDEDPILEAYRDAFPDLFTDVEDMPDELTEHLRYPEDLFRVQTGAYGRYHQTDPANFFSQDNTWSVARDPGTAGADPTTPVTDESGQATGETNAPRIAPYYQVLELPPEEGEERTDAEMVLMRQFVPFSEGDERQQLTAFMAARMDPGHYGELVAYEMATDDLPAGPGIVAATIQSDETVSRMETELGQAGSEVRFGNLLLIPVDGGLLYVQPFYVVAESETRQLPRLERVIVEFNGRVVTENTLSGALEEMFGERANTQEDPGSAPSTDEEGEAAPPEGAAPSGSAAEQAGQLLEQAEDMFEQADEALADRDLATYEERLAEARSLVEEAVGLLGGETPDSDSDADAAEGSEAGSAASSDSSASSSGSGSSSGTTSGSGGSTDQTAAGDSSVRTNSAGGGSSSSSSSGTQQSTTTTTTRPSTTTTTRSSGGNQIDTTPA